MTLLQLPITDSISQIALRNEQSSLAGTRRRGLEQQQQRQQSAFDQSKTLQSLKIKGIEDPQARAIALQLDPNYGKQLQDYQKQQQEFEAKKTIYWGSQASASAQAPLAMRPGLYNNLYEKARSFGEDVSNFPLPSEKWTDAHQGALEFIAQSAVEPAKMMELRQKQEMEQRRLSRGVDKPSSVREFEYFSQLEPEQQQKFMNVKRDIYKTGLTTDQQGNVIIMPGAAESKRTLKQQESVGTAEGKTIVQTSDELKSAESKLPELENAVKQLGRLGKVATYTKTGVARDDMLRQLGRPMTKAGVARAEYISMVDNQVLPLLRDTFGAVFTEREGQTLRATLGDSNASPSEKQAKLNAFIRQKKASIGSMKRKLGKETQSKFQDGQTATNPQTGETLTYSGGKWQ